MEQPDEQSIVVRYLHFSLFFVVPRVVSARMRTYGIFASYTKGAFSIDCRSRVVATLRFGNRILCLYSPQQSSCLDKKTVPATYGITHNAFIHNVPRNEPHLFDRAALECTPVNTFRSVRRLRLLRRAATRTLLDSQHPSTSFRVCLYVSLWFCDPPLTPLPLAWVGGDGFLHVSLLRYCVF